MKSTKATVQAPGQPTVSGAFAQYSSIVIPSVHDKQSADSARQHALSWSDFGCIHYINSCIPMVILCKTIVLFVIVDSLFYNIPLHCSSSELSRQSL